MRNVLDELFAEAQAAHDAHSTGTARGPLIPWSPRLSREVCGHLSPGLHVVHAPPGAGKTAFASQLAAECGCPALFVSAEMGVLEVLRRQIARHTSTFLSKLRTGALSGGEVRVLAQRTAAALPDFAIVDATRGPVLPAQLQEFARSAHGDRPHLLIVVDSLHTWSRGAVGGDNEYDKLNAGLTLLDQLGRSENCAVLAVAHRNRENMDSEGQNSGKGTSLIEYLSETVFALRRDPKSRPDPVTGEVPILVTLAKNRVGPAGISVELQFRGATMTFRDPELQERTLRPA